MNYQEAFKHIIDQRGLDSLNDTFLVHSLLSDLIGSSLDDVGLLNAYYSLNRQLPLCSFIQNKTLAESKAYIKSLIAKSNNVYTVTQYIRSVEPLLLILYPKEYVPITNFQAKAQSQKIDVVRNNRQEQNERVKVLIRQAIVNAKATPQKKHKAPKPKYIAQPCTSVTINASCTRLSVTYNSGKDIKITDSFNNDVTSSASITQKGNKVTIDISNKHYGFTIMLPKRKYGDLLISYSGYTLRLDGDDTMLFNSDRVELNCNKSYTYLYVKTKEFRCNQNKGKLFIYGEVPNAFMSINKSNVDCYIAGNGCNYYVIHSNKGDINLEFEEGKVRPKINHIFKPVDCVKGRYYVGRRSIKLELTTNKGHIRVR